MASHALSKMVVVAAVVLLLGVTPAVAAAAITEAYETEAVIKIEGANPWGAVLISGGREVLVAEQTTERLGFSVREAATGRELRRLRARYTGWDAHWAPSQDGARIVLGGFGPDQPWIAVVEVATDEEVRKFTISNGFDDVAISPDGGRIAAILHSPTRLVAWDVGSGEKLQEITGTDVKSIVFSPDGTRLLGTSSRARGLIGGNEAIAELWDVTSGRRLVEVKAKDIAFSGAIFSPDGTRFLTANAGFGNLPPASLATLWAVDGGRELLAIGRGEGAAARLSFSADGTRFATASPDRRVRVWDAGTGGLIAVLAAHNSPGVAGQFSEDGSGRYIQVNESLVPGVVPAFAGDGTSLVTSGLDGLVKIWIDVAERRVADESALGANLAAARAGDAEAMYRLSSAYRDGRGVERNDALATQWMTQAADGGHGPASLELANALLSGDAGRQDCAAGGERLRKAIASVSVEAGAKLDAVLSPLGGRQGAAALTPQIQADLLEAQIIDVLTRQEYPAFLANLCALEALGHADRLPAEARRELLYHRAVGLRAAGKPSAALAALNQYLNEAGNTGANYTQAIQLLRPLQEEAK